MLTAGIILTIQLMTTDAMQRDVPHIVYEEPTCEEPEVSQDIIDICYDIGMEHGVCPSILLAIIENESHGNADAKSSTSSAIGLMQIIPRYNEKHMNKHDVDDLTDPYQNVLVGTSALLEYCEEFQDIGVALTAYRYGQFSDEVRNAQETGTIYPYVQEILDRSYDLERWFEYYGY